MAVKAGIAPRDLATGFTTQPKPGTVADGIGAQQDLFGLGVDVARAQLGRRLIASGRKQRCRRPDGHVAIGVPRPRAGHLAIVVAQQCGGLGLEDDEPVMLFDQIGTTADMRVDVDLVALSVKHVDPRRHVYPAATQPGDRYGIGVEHDSGERRIAPAIEVHLLPRGCRPEHPARQYRRPAQRRCLFDDDHARAALRGPAGGGHSRHAAADDQQVARDRRFIAHKRSQAGGLIPRTSSRPGRGRRAVLRRR